MKISRLFLISLLSIVFMSSVFAEPEPQKIAVIDIQRVVSASSQVKALKKSHEQKSKEIAGLITKAQADIKKQSDEKKQAEVASKYEKQLVDKQAANVKEYTAKLQEIDKDITAQIEKKARTMGYTMVLPKSAVIFGGDDITEEMLKVIK